MTAGVDGSVDPEEAARDSRRDRRPGVRVGDGVPVPPLGDQGVRGEDNVSTTPETTRPAGAGPRSRPASVGGGPRNSSLRQWSKAHVSP